MGNAGPLDLDTRDLICGASAEQRLLAAVHRRFRRYGGSPSHGELCADTRISTTQIGRLLDRLQLAGFLHLTRGRARSIVLVRRGAMLSDMELELEALARGLALHRPAATMTVLAEAYPVDGANPELELSALLDQIDHAEERSHGAGAVDEPHQEQGLAA